MNTYLSTTFEAEKKPPTEVLRALREYDVKSVELGSTHAHEEKLGEKLTEEFGDFAFLTHNFFPPPVSDDLVINFSDPRSQFRDASIEQATANLLFAARIGSKLHTIHPGFLTATTVRRSEGRNFDFSFDDDKETQTPRDAFERMINSLIRLKESTAAVTVPVAIETQGTITNSRNCLFQTSAEIRELRGALGSACPGISVNLGHLNLAARVFGFDRFAFIEEISESIVAFEVSHNDGTGDQHLPLRPDEWYWDIIRDRRFAGLPMILEVRDVAIAEACANLELLEQMRTSVEVSTNA